MGLVCCSVCGSCNSKPYLGEGNFTVVACLECGHLYTSPLPDADTIASSYEESGDWIKPTDIAVRSGADSRFSRYAAELESILAPKARIIEIGCSKGRLLHLLQQRGFDCYGVEPSRDAEIATQLLGADRVVHALYNKLLPFKSDAVTMFEALEHIPEPHKTTTMIFDQLCPGGYFMGSVPNSLFIRAKVWPRRKLGLQSLLVPLIMDAGNHINYFSPRGIQAMLERTGFEFLWVRNAPLDLNYSANRLSPLLKRLWQAFTLVSGALAGNLLGSNIWFLARKPR